MPNLMTNGEFFHIISDAISGSEAHADLIELCHKAKALQKAVLAYLEKYEDRDLSEELLGMVTLRLTHEQRAEYLEQIQDEIEDWDHGAFFDVSGFNWSLNTFASVVEGQIYGGLGDESEADTVLDDSTEEAAIALVVQAAA
jgi:hypothetical protein